MMSGLGFQIWRLCSLWNPLVQNLVETLSLNRIVSTKNEEDN